MPFISRLMIKFSLLYLMAGITIGAALLINKAWVMSEVLWLLLPIHIEFLIFGWVIQFTLGVAYWILPRYLKSKGRGSKSLASKMAVLLNAGIWMMITSYLLELNLLAISGRILELIAVALFVYLHWNRVKTYKHN